MINRFRNLCKVEVRSRAKGPLLTASIAFADIVVLSGRARSQRPNCPPVTLQPSVDSRQHYLDSGKGIGRVTAVAGRVRPCVVRITEEKIVDPESVRRGYEAWAVFLGERIRARMRERASVHQRSQSSLSPKDKGAESSTRPWPRA